MESMVSEEEAKKQIEKKERRKRRRSRKRRITAIRAGRSESFQPHYASGKSTFMPIKLHCGVDQAFSGTRHLDADFRFLHNKLRGTFDSLRKEYGWPKRIFLDPAVEEGFLTADGKEYAGRPGEAEALGIVDIKDDIGEIENLLIKLDISTLEDLNKARGADTIDYRTWVKVLQYMNKKGLLDQNDRRYLVEKGRLVECELDGDQLVGGEIVWNTKRRKR
jgi:hypothetical protein